LVLPGGAATFNVAIRTVVLDTADGSAEYGVGGGITWDSTAEGEYAEVGAKAALLSAEWPSFELLETLLLRQGDYVLLDGHLARLAESAHYFGIPLALDGAQAVLETHAREHGCGEHRVRLLVSQAGAIRVESEPLRPLPPAPLPVALALAPVSQYNRFLFHKTTRRDLYEQHRAAAPHAFDVLLWNEQGELTELTIGNLVLELDGCRWTPPRQCGLLAGVLRAELLAQGLIRERVLRPEDLARATGLWLINSVRGWVELQIVP
jgi:para-aminobenzoate synthetase/4-amino-4-deoxychorismate lyase